MLWSALSLCLADLTPVWVQPIEQLASCHFMTTWNPRCHKGPSARMIKPWCIHLLCFSLEKTHCSHSLKGFCSANMYVFFFFTLTDFGRHLAPEQQDLWSCRKCGAVEGAVPSRKHPIRAFALKRLNSTGTFSSGRQEEEAMWTARLLVFASLFSPAALGEFGSLQLVCLCLCGADVGTSTCHCSLWHDLKPYQNVLFLTSKCQIRRDKSLWLTSVTFFCRLYLLPLISSFLLLKLEPGHLFSSTFSFLHSLVCFFFDLFWVLSLFLLSVSRSPGNRKLTTFWFQRIINTVLALWLIFCRVRIALRITEGLLLIISHIKSSRLSCEHSLFIPLSKRRPLQHFPLAFCELFQRHSKWTHLNSD